MKNNASFVYALFLIVGDFLALVAAFSAAYILRVKFDHRPLIQAIPAFTYFYAFLTVLPLWILVHAFIGLYNHEVYEKRFSELGRLMIGSFIGILVVIGYDFINPHMLFPARLVPVYALALGFSFLVLFRTIARMAQKWMYSFGFGVSNVLIIGDTFVSQEMVDAIRHTKTTGLRVLGLVGRQVSGFKTYPNFEGATQSLHQHVHSIIQTELYKNQEKNNEILEYAQQNHIAYRFIPGNSDLFVGNIQVELFASLPMIAVHQTALIGWGRIAKRLFDIIVSSLLLIITSPIMILLASAIKLSAPRTRIFFRQVRLTRFNREFEVYKFRTVRAAYNGLSPEEGFKKMGKPGLAKKFRENGNFLPKDPRITSIGKFIRRTSLDELPQLINVLKGDLSLVGPRALVARDLEAYKKHTILSVKSGMTGLAQVSGRNNIPVEERRKLDIYYVQNWSFWLDLVILMKTIRVVLTKENKDI